MKTVRTPIYTHNVVVPYGATNDLGGGGLPLDGRTVEAVKSFILRTSLDRATSPSIFIPKGCTLRVVRTPSGARKGFHVVVEEVVEDDDDTMPFVEDEDLYDEDEMRLDCHRDSLA